MTVDGSINIMPDGAGKAIDNCVVQRGGQDFYRQRVETYPGNPSAHNLDGQARSSQTMALFDGKIMNAEDPLKWDTKGTGTATFSENAITMAVTANQYLIRQSQFFCPYFSGKPQLVETTHANLAMEAGLIKRIGYFSSSAVAPYDADYDGVWLESDGATYRLVTSKFGVVTHSIDWQDWDNFAAVENYDWSKFTVNKLEFLWLGGAGLRLFMVVDGAFTLIHTIANHAGYQDGLIFLSPNQPVRYEIRSTGGAGSMRAICSQVATDGATISESGEGVAIHTPSIATNTAGTLYALCGMRKQAAYRNHFIPVAEFGIAQTAGNADAGVLMLLLNPALSAPLVWANNSRIQTAIATGQTVTNPARILKAVPFSGSAVSAQAPNAALRVLACGIDNTMGELILAYSPLTANQSVAGSMQALEY